MSTTVRIQVVSTYPDKTAIISVAPDSTLGDLKTAAAKELKIDLKEYAFSSIAFGEDVTSLASVADTTKPGIKDNWTLIAAAPTHLLPPRKRKTDEKKDDETDEKFKDFTPENVFKKLATTKGRDKKIALEYLDTYASDIVKTPIFSKLPASAIVSVAKRDGLSISEIELFEAVLKWADSELKKEGKTPSPETRGAVLKEILPHIRFPIMSTEEIASKVSASGLLTSPQTLELFTFLAQKDNPSAVPGPSLKEFKFKPRSSAGAKLAPPSDEFGDGGIFWWIGSGGGKKTWANPHTAGLVRMYTSDNPSWTSGWSEVNLVDLLSTSRTLSTDYSMNTGTWFAVDLKDYRVQPTHYTMKNGGGRGLVLRDWALEAKVKETDSWTAIRRHTGDSTYGSDGKNGYGIHRFAIDPVPKEFFRFFRILRTDTNQAIYVHRWEIYGTIKKSK